MDRAQEQRRFSLINAAVLPVWTAMIVAPRSRITARVVQWSDVVLAGLAVSYAAQLAQALDPPMDLTRARVVREAMSQPEAFLAGWAHFATFDLFVGRWIWATALREDRSCRLALILTMMAGPTGLATFSVQRRRTTSGAFSPTGDAPG